MGTAGHQMTRTTTAASSAEIHTIEFLTRLKISETSSLPITSSSNSNCITVLISVQYKASSCLLPVLIPDPGILVCLLQQAKEIFYSITPSQVSDLQKKHFSHNWRIRWYTFKIIYCRLRTKSNPDLANWTQGCYPLHLKILLLLSQDNDNNTITVF